MLAPARTKTPDGRRGGLIAERAAGERSNRKAAPLARVTVRSIYARVEAEGVHFLETPDGLLLLCANSLSQWGRLGALEGLVGATNPGSAPRGEGVMIDRGRF